MNLSTLPVAKAVAAIVVFEGVTAAALVGVSLVAGGSGGSSPNLATPTQSPYGTPPPPKSPYPTQDPSLPTPPADTPDPNAPTPFVPPFVTISGIDIPIPHGFQYAYGAAIGDPGPGKPFYSIWMDDSMSQQTATGSVDSRIQFDDSGLLYAHIAPSEEAAFAPTLDDLWMLTQKIATPSPPFVTVNGRSIPSAAGFVLQHGRGPDGHQPTDLYRAPAPLGVQFRQPRPVWSKRAARRLRRVSGDVRRPRLARRALIGPG